MSFQHDMAEFYQESNDGPWWWACFCGASAESDDADEAAHSYATHIKESLLELITPVMTWVVTVDGYFTEQGWESWALLEARREAADSIEALDNFVYR